ncbi:hypothetical protein [Pedobacter ginsengisoli]|uniref:hypothetical protein n=1 Tax=Pedobacter ginsengisoli TaxID=363852 RepID=UPI00254B5A1D|nr:hypothetical protein [Pedobacter ginsengisoli]
MSLIDTFKRLENLNHHIRNKSTGSRAELATKMEISVSTLQDYINFMKEVLNAPIEYDHHRRTYFFKQDGSFDFRFQARVERIVELEFYDYLQKFLAEKNLKMRDKLGGDEA